MTNDRNHFLFLLKKYREGSTTLVENELLEKYYDDFDLREDVLSTYTQHELNKLQIDIKLIIDERINSKKQKQRPALFKTIGLYKYWIAASLAGIMVLIVYSIELSKKPLQKPQKFAIMPYKGPTLLTTSSGSKIVLDKLPIGKTRLENGNSVSKAKDGSLIFASNQSGSNGNLPNTITTSTGSVYHLVLPDGSSVWLNAKSSISFPSNFSSTIRAVDLEGEAYFEVSKRKGSLFRVTSKGQVVEVTGTHFNINCYQNEAIVKTTLLEGSVRVQAAGITTNLVPGDQSILTTSTNTILKQQLNVEEEVEWKDGIFSFNGKTVHQIMRQISRWYDIEVTFSNNLPEDLFFGEIPNNSSLDQVLEILKINKINNRLNGKKLYIYKQEMP